MALNSKIIEAFKNAFEEDCFELITMAYQTVLKEKIYDTNWLENDFSELLAFCVNENELSISKNITCKTENKLLTSKTNLTKKYGDKLPRIDFLLTSIRSNNRFSYFMESKRLKEKDSYLKREYIDEGIDRFISKKYPYGCMIGYLLEGNPRRTVDGINSLLKKDQRINESLKNKPHNFHSDYFESKHTGIGILKHFVFDYSN